MDNPGYETFKRNRREGTTSNCTSSQSPPISLGNIRPNQLEMKREIGLFNCLGLIIGGVIGSGIFISPKGVLIGCGSVGLTLSVWVLCGFFSLLAALCFAELGTLMPVSGGEYIYMLEAFAPRRRKEKLFWGPLVAFLYNFQGTFFIKPAVLAVQAMACSSYLISLMSVGCIGESQVSQPDVELQTKLIAASLVVLITTVNCFSVSVSTKFINTFTAVKLLALLVIIVGGFWHLWRGTNEALHTGFQDTTFGGIALAFYSGLWAFSGWDNVNAIAREIKNPKKNLLWSLVLSCIIITAIYLLTNISYFIFLSKNEFLASDAVAVHFGLKMFGAFGGYYMVFSVALSVLGSVIGASLMNTRISYTAAREGHLMDVMAYLHIHHRSPSIALIFNCMVSLVLIVRSNVLSLIFATGFMDSIFMSLTMGALLVFRRTKRNDERAIKVNLIIPVISMGFYLFLVTITFVEDPKLENLYVIGILMLGISLYVPFVYYEVRIRKLDWLKKLLQLILEVALPEDPNI